jgi:hypothetical protein
MSVSAKKFENYIELYKLEQVKREKISELNEILNDTNIEVFIEPNTNHIILYSKENGQPMFKILNDVIKEFQAITKKIENLKTFFQSIKDVTPFISYGHISNYYDEIKFVYKNIQIEIKFKDDQLFIESNFKFKKQTTAIQFGNGNLIVRPNDSYSDDLISYRIEKQIDMNDFKTEIFDEMLDDTKYVLKNNLQIDINDYSQVDTIMWMW